jgi:dTDP-4-dehydrorhamnose reductase
MKILIIGASGFLGSSLYNYLKLKYEVVGTYCTNYYPEFKYLNLLDVSYLVKFFEINKFDIVIHCGGLTRPDFCEKNKELTYNVNVESTKHLVKLVNSKIIYISTDYVFDGRKDGYNETDTKNPINIYGKSKSEAEDIILQNPRNVVVRISGLYGFNSHNNEFINSLNSKNIEKATDLLGSTLLLDDIQLNCVGLFGDLSGIYHFSSQTTISRYDFFQLVLEILEVPAKLIGNLSRNLYTIAQRPINTTLYSNKNIFIFNNEEDGLNIIHDQYSV